MWAKHRSRKCWKCWACWPAAPPTRGPTAGLLKLVLLNERAGNEILGCVGPTPWVIHPAEVGGQVGEELEAVYWE